MIQYIKLLYFLCCLSNNIFFRFHMAVSRHLWERRKILMIMNRSINHGVYNTSALVFLKLKSTHFPETKGLQLWNPKLTLLLLSWKRLRIKDVKIESLKLLPESQSLLKNLNLCISVFKHPGCHSLPWIICLQIFEGFHSNSGWNISLYFS